MSYCCFVFCLFVVVLLIDDDVNLVLDPRNLLLKSGQNQVSLPIKRTCKKLFLLPHPTFLLCILVQCWSATAPIFYSQAVQTLAKFLLYQFLPTLSTAFNTEKKAAWCSLPIYNRTQTKVKKVFLRIGQTIFLLRFDEFQLGGVSIVCCSSWSLLLTWA